MSKEKPQSSFDIKFGGNTTYLDWGATHKLFKENGQLDEDYIRRILTNTIRDELHMKKGDDAARGTWEVRKDWIDEDSTLAGGTITVEVNIKVMNGDKRFI